MMICPQQLVDPLDVQSRSLEAAARRPHDRDELAERLRDGRF
jgi:hypothetical protein